MYLIFLVFLRNIKEDDLSYKANREDVILVDAINLKIKNCIDRGN